MHSWCGAQQANLASTFFYFRGMVCSIYFSSEWSECRGPRYPSGLASGDPSVTVKNTYSICITFLLLIYYQWSYSQSWLWAKSFGSDKLDYGSQATILKDGNILTTGDFVGLNLYLPDSTIVGNVNRSAFVAKYNQAGNLLNITICKGAPNGGGDAELGRFAEDEAGNLYTAGSSAGGAWFDTCFIVSGGGGNACIAKFNSDLRCKWVKKHSSGSANGQTFLNSFYSKGNLFHAGFASGLNNYIDTFYITNPDGNLNGKAFYCRFDTSSKCIWTKQSWGGFTNADIGGISDGKLFSVVRVDSCFLYDTVNTCDQNGFGFNLLLQLDTNGLILWTKKIESAHGSSISGFCLGNNGKSVIAGAFDSTLYINGLTLNKTNGAYADAYISKYNSNGTPLWLKHITGTFGTSVLALHLDTFDKLYVCGEFIGTSNFGNGVTLSSTYNNKYDMFIARYDANGNCMGAFKQHGVSPVQITQDSAANPIIVGSIYPDSAVLGDIHLVSKGQQDFFIGKLSAITGSSSSKTIEPDGFLNIYANPNAGLFTVEVPQAFKGNEARLIIYGPLGELVKDEPTDISNSRVSVNLGEVVRGIYTVVLQSTKGGLRAG
jgi:hypothetical protein